LQLDLGGWKTQWHTTNQNGKEEQKSLEMGMRMGMGMGHFFSGCWKSQKKNDFNKCHKFARQLYKRGGGSGKAKEMAFPQTNPPPLPLIIVCFAVGL